MSMFEEQLISEEDKELVAKWKPALESPDVAPIEEFDVQLGTARLLENTVMQLESTPNSTVANIANIEPAMLSMVRRMGPTIFGNQLVGVQAMPGPVSQVFAIRPRYDNA